MSIPESHLAQEAIAALVDGELPSGPASRAARHLAGCGQCRMAVEAQREAKEVLHRCADVAVPGDLLSRLRAIPFTADVPGSGGPGTLSAGPGQLTVQSPGGAFAVPLDPQPASPDRPGHARWLRRGVVGALAGLGLGVGALAVNLPAAPAGQIPSPPASVAGPSAEQRSQAVPPVARSVSPDAGTFTARSAADHGGTP
jgi:anti-sigma factor RsiW